MEALGPLAGTRQTLEVKLARLPGGLSKTYKKTVITRAEVLRHSIRVSKLSTVIWTKSNFILRNIGAFSNQALFRGTKRTIPRDPNMTTAQAQEFLKNRLRNAKTGELQKIVVQLC